MAQLWLTYDHHLSHEKEREETEFLEELLQCFTGFTEFYFTGWGVRDKQLRTVDLLGVKKLCLKGCWRLTDNGIANLCTAGCNSVQGWASQLMELDISRCVGLTDATGVILRSYATTSLTALNISNTAIGDERIYHVLEAATNLKQLRAQSCHGLTDQGLLHILTSIKRYKSLQLLDISECQCCTDNGVMSLLSGSGCLTELFLANSIQLSTCALLGLDRAPLMTTSLHQLNLQGIKFHDNAMEWITAGCKHLTTLNISSCTTLTNHALHVLGHGCLPLQDLDISSCSEFTDTGLGKFLTLRGKILKRLVIDGCFQAADETISAIGGCEELCILSARDITRPSDRALKNLATGTGCKWLSEVNFSAQLDGIDLTSWRYSPRFGAIGIQAIVAASSKQLVSLQIDGVFKVDDRVLRQLGATCPALKTLSLKEVSRVTDMGMGALARGCPLLSHLVVSGCYQLTDKSVIYVARPLLEYLNIGGCKKMMDTALLALASRSPSLTWLSVRNCEWIGDRGSIPLLKSCRKLKYLDAGGLVDITSDTLDCLPPTFMRGNFRSCPQISGEAVSMAAKTLPLVQVMAGQPFCIEPADLACRMYNSYCIEKNWKDRAALIIQICYRGMKRFRNIRKRQHANLKMRRGVHCLELFLNRIYTRRSIEMLLKNAMHQQHLIRSIRAAVQVQRMWRGHCGRHTRDVMVTRRDLAAAWHCLSEGLKLERRDKAKSRAVSIIQQAVRMWLFELEASRLKEVRWKSSIIIQGVWRRCSARMKAIEIAKQKVRSFSFLHYCSSACSFIRKLEMKEKQNPNPTVCLHLNLVITQVREREQLKIHCQMTLSAWWRALRGNKQDILQHTVQERLQQVLLKRQTKAATDIQRTWKRFVMTKQNWNAYRIQKFLRKGIKKQKRMKAVLVIQREWRQHHTVTQQMRARLISGFLDRHIIRQKRRSAAAVVQRAWRCYVAREELRKKNKIRIWSQITMFQAVVRGMLVRSITILTILNENRAGMVIVRTLRAAVSRSRFERYIRAKKVKAIAHSEALQRANLIKKRREKRIIALLVGQTREGAARTIQRHWRVKAESLHEESRKHWEKIQSEKDAQMHLVSNSASFNIVKRARNTLRSLRQMMQEKSVGTTPGQRSRKQSKPNSTSHNNNKNMKNRRQTSTRKYTLRDDQDTISLPKVAHPNENSIPKLDKEYLAQDPRALAKYSILKWQSQSFAQKKIGDAAWTVGYREKNEFHILQQRKKSSKQLYMEILDTNLAYPSSKHPVFLWLQLGSGQDTFTDMRIHYVPKYNSPASAKSRQQAAAQSGNHIIGHSKLSFELYCTRPFKSKAAFEPEIDGIEFALTSDQEKTLLKKEYKKVSGPLGAGFAVRSIWIHIKAEVKPPESLNLAIKYMEQFSWFSARTQITMEKHALQLQDIAILYQIFEEIATIRRNKDGLCITSKQLFWWLREPETVCWQWFLSTIGAKLDSSLFWDDYLEMVCFFSMFDKYGLYRWTFTSLDSTKRGALSVDDFEQFTSAVSVHEGVLSNFTQKCLDQFRRYSRDGTWIDFPRFTAVLDACPRLSLPIQRLQSAIAKQNLGNKFWFRKKKLFMQIREEFGVCSGD